MTPQTALDPLPGIYHLDKNLIAAGFLDGNGSLSVGISDETSATAVQKVLSNGALGQDEFVVDKLEAKAGAQASGVTFAGSAGQVGFKASGDIYAELAVFPNPASDTFASALGPVADTKFTLPAAPDMSAVMLRWGADAKVSGSGSIALGAGAGTLDFSAGAQGELFFCVIQQLPQTMRTDDALRSVVQSWKLPVHVRTPEDLAPRTYIVSEVGGSLTASISATFGHQFNWVRQVGNDAIFGDIGLKLQLGLTAAFDLTTQGKYAVAIGRESEAAVLRVRIYKLKLNSFDFALTASAAATAKVPAPDSFDDLLKAALGTHAMQILNELEDPGAIDKWIGQFGPEYVTDLLKKFTGLDLAAAIARMNDLITRWKALPGTVASLFTKFAEANVPDFSDIQQAAQILANQDTAELKTFLNDATGKSAGAFFSTPVGQYLEGIADNGALALLQNIPAAARDAAKQTLLFLSGAPVEKLLNQVVTEIDSRLGIDSILADIQGDPAKVLDKLLFSKLEAFLSRTPVLQDIHKLQNTIKTLQQKTGALYDKTLKALESTYKAQLSATYQQTTTDTALIDASFDFDLNRDNATRSLQQLLAGRLDDFLTQPESGVTLASGALTHQVKRHSHVDLTLPFLQTQGDWVSNAVTSFNAVDHSDGRLTAYQLNETGTQITKDTFTSLWKGRNWRSTSIALTAQLSAMLTPGGQLRVFADGPAEMQNMATSTASVRLEVSDMSLTQLEAGVEPFAVQFMPKAFADQGAFLKWAATGQLLAEPGNTLVSLDVLVPAAVPLAWIKNSVTNKKDPIYKQLSLTLQFLLKRYLRDYYFRDIKRYDDLATAYVVLLYAGIPPSTAIKVNGEPSSVQDGIYWDTEDIESIQQMARLALSSGTAQSFPSQLAQAQQRLLKAGQTALAKFYDPQNAGSIFETALNIPLLRDSLLTLEGRVIFDARDAALSAALANGFIAARRPSDALKSLADFGNKIANAFNNDLGSIFVSDTDALQRLSALIFAQASTVFDATVSTTRFDSTLNVTVLKPGVAMPSDFPDFTVTPQDTLVSLNAASFGI